MKKDSVYLVWNNKNTGNKFTIGELYKENDTFYFRYILENVAAAMKEGFQLLIAFPQLNATYNCPFLFAAFSSRLPDETRPEIKEILETYGMKEYDEFELLKRSGAKLPIDSFEFVEA